METFLTWLNGLRFEAGRSAIQIHTEKHFQNLIKSTRNQIVFTIFRLIWIQTEDRLDPNQSENGKYNLISGWFNKISKIFLCVYRDSIQTGMILARMSRKSRLSAQ